MAILNDKRGLVAIYLFMIGIVFFFLGMALAPALTETSGEVQTDLDCTNSSISNQNKAICYQVDSMPPLFVGILFGFAGMILGRIFI